ncbi:MAG: PilZ domain-containing protein [Phycisphaerales bacterium]|nr:PilZ domain-containing protein [Planctomycetota bacterium]MCH8508266.1 PilZ domain-containing protein [Phycisphaerales bacterium]
MAQSGLIIRRSIRHEIVLPAQFRVAPEHAESVRYAKGVADADGWVGVDLVDFASGGAGFISTVFVPRGVVVELRIPDPEVPDAEPLVVARTRAVRVQMTDRRPAYLIGVAYVDPDERTVAQVESMLTRIEGSAA